MTIPELLKWGWAHDRGAFLIPILTPAAFLIAALMLEIAR